MRKSNTIDMVNGPLVKNILIFSMPLVAMNLLQMLFNAADTIVVGKFAGQEALAAVGATGSLIFLLTSIFNGLSIGTNVIIAKAIGEGNHEKISKSVSSSILMGFIGGILLAVVGLFTSRTCLELMSTPKDIIEQSDLYMKIYLSGSIFMITYNFASAILRSKGDTKRPLYFLIISGVINAILNLTFVIVFHLDVAGVALATVISQGVGCFLILYVITNEIDATRLDLKHLQLDMDVVKETMRIGVPAGIQGAAFSLSNVVIQSSINSFDSSVIVAGNSAAINVENFVYIGMMAIAQSTISFTSQNIGANKKDKVFKIMWVTMILDILSALLIGITAWYFGEFFLSFYTNDALVIETGKLRLFYVAAFLFLNGVLDIFINSMRGMGRSTLPTIFMLIGVCGFRLMWLWFYFPSHADLATIYLCYPLSWIITILFEGYLWIDTYRKMMKKGVDKTNDIC